MIMRTKKIPKKVTRYYMCSHNPNLPYELDQKYFRTYTSAAKALPSHKALGDDAYNKFFVAKVTTEPATELIPQRNLKRKAS